MRPIIPSNEILKIFLCIKKREVHWCWCKKNPDLIESYKYLKNKFPNTELKPYYIHLSDGVDRSIVAFEKNEVYNFTKKAIDYIFSKDKINTLYNFFLNNSLYNYSLKEDFQENIVCNTPSIMEFNLEGVIFQCRNVNKIVAKIGDSESKIFNFLKFKWKGTSIPLKCYSCKFYKHCRRDCPLICLNEDKTELLSCYYMKEMYQAMSDTGLMYFD